MAKIISPSNLLCGAVNYFISPVKNCMIAFKLTYQQAVNFHCHYKSTKQLEEAFGAENRLKPGEYYDGYVAILVHPNAYSRNFLLGKLKGSFSLADPANVQLRDASSQVEEALQKGILWWLDDNKQSFNKMLIVNEMPLAAHLKNHSEWRYPDGEPDEVDKSIKQKLIHSLLTGEEADLTEDEEYFLSDAFIFEYRLLFK